MLDVEESMLDVATEERRDVRDSLSVRRTGDSCAGPRGSTRRWRPRPTRSARSASTTGVQWVALRQCLVCGNVGCCDSSPMRHATAHFHETTHPVMESAEPGEDWRWCFVHHTTG